ncbi:DNA-3-methyladenine glycosylase 2 [Ornithinibacillus scapharcae]|uniref:DNA-3-methyladenine glycosylase 2 n=1 Tax=Ornithinibacillus scapharcae TaxID=1147159 RepID=UPI000225ADBA|nr:DNA-3-methyladenine glycosylase 2 [Ornithinibacillus scapharcae]
MNWVDHETYIEIIPPKEFNFNECLIFLGRSDQEILYRMKEDAIYTIIKGRESFILCRISYDKDVLKIEFPNGVPTVVEREKIGEYIWEWFDLERDLAEFYRIASKDTVLRKLTERYHGLRIIGIPDLFEAFVWAIIGQQINLTFAYTLKKRFVEQYGEVLTFEDETYWAFPTFEKIATIHVEELKALQFSTRKAEYIIGIAKLMNNGDLSKEFLMEKQNYQDIKDSLISIRGIGAWTADYVMMKCLHQPSAFPIADVGIHQALKHLLKLEKKPSIEEIEKLAVQWKGWQAYATFYLWRSLYDETI